MRLKITLSTTTRYIVCVNGDDNSVIRKNINILGPATNTWISVWTQFRKKERVEAVDLDSLYFCFFFSKMHKAVYDIVIQPIPFSQRIQITLTYLISEFYRIGIFTIRAEPLFHLRNLILWETKGEWLHDTDALYITSFKQ